MARDIKDKDRAVGVIGAGKWGQNLIRIFYQIGLLKMVCDKDKIAVNDVKRRYPEVEICLELNDIISRKDIQALVIATPAETHYNITKIALTSEKNVLVEKPLSLTVRDAKKLVQLAEDKGLTLMVGHLLQYHPAFIKLKDLAKSGELGRINYIYSHRLNLGRFRREENILWSFAPHDISMILSIAGEDPENVITTGGNYLHNQIADVTTTHLEFPSGMRAHIFVSWLHPFKEQKLVVVGDAKMAVFDDTKPWEDKLLLYPHEIKWQENVPIPKKADPERIKIYQYEPLHEECKHFIDCFVHGKQPMTNGREGLRVLKVLKASQRSLDDRCRKVNFSIPKKNTLNSVCDSRENIFVHDSAVIDDKVVIGAGSKIWHFSHIMSGTIIGERCNLGQNVAIGPDVTIGQNCKIQNNVSVYKGVTLEDDVFCGPSIVFTNVFRPRAEIRKMNQVRPTLVKKGATIGANATIVCGITLGKYSFIGAAAMVTKNVPDYAIVVGNPAKLIGWACKCGERLPDNLRCMTCGKYYIMSKDGVLKSYDEQ